MLYKQNFTKNSFKKTIIIEIIFSKITIINLQRKEYYIWEDIS